ncbi:MAG: HDOD domain-containing protein [Pseudomonadota bacterium]
MNANLTSLPDLKILPPLPQSAQIILASFDDDFVDPSVVVGAVESDPGLCARLLSIANSAYYRLPEPLDSIQTAVTRVIGVDTVRTLALALSAQSAFDTHRCRAFSTGRFWRDALLAAQSTKEIAKRDLLIDDAAKGMAYAVGLCHNLGLMALAHLAPKETQRALKLSEEPGDLCKNLVKEFGDDHRSVTAQLAEVWQLPEAMTTAYGYRASQTQQEEDRLGPILAAAVSNLEAEDVTDVADVSEHAVRLGMSAHELNKLVVMPESVREAANDMASRMAG